MSVEEEGGLSSQYELTAGAAAAAAKEMENTREMFDCGLPPSSSVNFPVDDDKYCPNLNHKKAALLVKEGRDNEKFESLPDKKPAWIAYRILHNPFYYWTALILAVALMLMAAFELPSVAFAREEGEDQGERIAHLLVELALLSFFAANMVLRFLWLGPKLFFKGRSTIACIIIIVMIIEAFVILGTNNRHFRITRALRPFLLLDTYLMYGVRRVVRQIFQCLKYIIDVMLVLFFLIAVFALVGYFLFTNINPTYFGNLKLSIVSMIITLTTANHPDVFMEAYFKSPFAPIFFMVYMFVTFYYFNNVLLAVLFAKFKRAEKKKYRKLYLHKREALHRAFALLKNTNNNIIFFDFLHFMKKYDPRIAPYKVMCLFKVLQSSNGVEGCLTWDEFSNFYDYVDMRWELSHKSGLIVTWYEKMAKAPGNFKKVLKYLHTVVSHWLFDIVITIIVLANLLYLLIFIITHEDDCKDNVGNDKFCSARLGIAGSFVFNFIYLVEVHLKLFINGPAKYFRKWANWVDYILVVGSFIFLCIEVGVYESDPNNTNFRYIAMIRPLKLLRLLRLKKNYFFLIRILIVLAARMTSVFILLIIVFYSFSIIGMEVFTGGSNKVFPGCWSANNTMKACIFYTIVSFSQDAAFGVGEYYENNGSIPDNPHLYWLNDFSSIERSYITLYEEMVVNNWFIQMEGFVSTTSEAARVFFILFWISSTLVVNIAIVYIVDAFESGILAVKASKNNAEIPSGELKRVARIILTSTEIRLLSNVIHHNITHERAKGTSINRWIRIHYDIPVRTIELYGGEFRGKRMMTDDDLRAIIYEGELEDWKEKYDEERSLRALKQRGSHIATYKESTLNFLKRTLLMLGENIKRLFFYILG